VPLSGWRGATSRGHDVKLLLCLCCMDVKALDDGPRGCRCGKTRGWYTDRRHAVVRGPGVCLGISNQAVMRALYGRAVAPEKRQSVDCWLHEQGYEYVTELHEPEAPKVPALRKPGRVLLDLTSIEAAALWAQVTGRAAQGCYAVQAKARAVRKLCAARALPRVGRRRLRP
jgi:hypothetical protein